MKISIIHATRRGQKAENVALNWLARAYQRSRIEYILSVDTPDTYEYEKYPLFDSVVRNLNLSAVEAFNKGAETAKNDIFVCISDDMECPLNWDLLLYQELEGKKDFYLKVKDGLQPTLVTLPIFDRIYYNHLGYVWNPLFRHMFVDQEATAVAIMTGKYLKSDLLFPHAHYTTGRNEMDIINERNNSTWTQGEALFNARLKTNFGIKRPILKYEDIKWK